MSPALFSCRCCCPLRGSTAITTAGTVTQSGSTTWDAYGVYAYNDPSATDITLTQTGGAVSGQNYGIYGNNQGTGSIQITSSGRVSGGIYGIYASQAGAGPTAIAIHGDVNGDAGAGILSVSGSDVTIDIAPTGTLTWYQQDGFYLDGQARLTWYDSDLGSKLARKNLVQANKGFGYASSIEGGKRIALDPAWSITPQAQLVYSNVDFDTYTDTFGARVGNGQGDSLQGRLGVALDYERSRGHARGKPVRTHVYGLANLHYEILDETTVHVAGKRFASGNDRLWASLGVGGSYNWSGDKYSIYGEGLVNTGLNPFGDSYSVVGQVGFRMRW